MKGFSLEFSAASMHWLAYSAGLISDGIDDLGLTLNFRLGTSDDWAGVEVGDCVWEGNWGRGDAWGAVEGRAEDSAEAGPGERAGVLDGGGEGVVERSVRYEAACGTCSEGSGSGTEGSVAAAGVFVIGEGGLIVARVGGWAVAEWEVARADSSLSTGVVALLDATDGTEDRTEGSDKADNEDSNVSRVRSGSTSGGCV